MGGILGVLIVHDKNGGKLFSREDGSLLELFCEQVGVSLVTASEYTTAQRALAHLQELDLASVAVASLSLDPDGVTRPSLEEFALLVAQVARALWRQWRVVYVL